MMSRFARTAAIVVGAVALAATGIGAAVGASIIGSGVAAGAAASTATLFGVSAATFTAVGAIAGATSALLSLAAGSPKGSFGGAQTQFKVDRDAGIPVIIGRTPAAYHIAPIGLPRKMEAFR